MNTALRRHHQGGFHLIELACCVGIIGILAAGSARFMKDHERLKQMSYAAEFEQQANRALIVLLADMKEANAESFPWTSLPAPTSLQFARIPIDRTTGLQQAAENITYAFQPDSVGGRGSLVRTKDGVDRVLLSPIDAPTVSDPLFQEDPVLPRVIVIAFTYHPSGMQGVRLMRRVTIRG